MKKIMFNDKYGFTDAVLSGNKTMTRRLLKLPITEINTAIYNLEWDNNKVANKKAYIKKYAQYKKGQVLAIAQSYNQVNKNMMDDFYNPIYDNFKAADDDDIVLSGGYDNKMFVSSELMPHQIKITDVRLERLQDINDEDCLCEGVEKWIGCYIVSGIMEKRGTNNVCFDTPREAFAALIDKILGKGTWESNPYIFTYKFKLIK